MANLGTTFDPNSVPLSDDLEAGEYHAHIVDSEMKTTKDGNGQYLNLEFDVISGPHEGRKFWSRLNLHNNNEMTQRIAQQTLAKICNAVGVAALQDSEDLHFKPMMVRLGYGKKGTDWEHKTDIKGIRPVGAVVSGPAPRPAGPPPAPRPAPSAPWPRRA